MTAKEYFFIWFNDNSNNPAFIYNHLSGSTGIDIDNVIKLLQEFAQLKCKEQREICAENVQMEIYTNRDDMSYLTKANSNTILDYNDGVYYEEYQQIYTTGIINSPEPKI